METLAIVVTVLLVLTMIGVIVGACKSLIWDEDADLREFGIGLFKKVPGHKIVNREKRPQQFAVGGWEYAWECECGTIEFSYSINESYRDFLRHRSYKRYQLAKAEWESKDKKPKKGWLL